MSSVRVFNGPVEVGLRALVLLVEAFPCSFDLQKLVILDHLILHSGDVDGGPHSLHPPSPLRSGEVAIRRALIEDGLALYRARALISQQPTSEGFAYVAADSGAAFLDALRAPYVERLRQRAEWAVARFGMLSADKLSRVLEQSLSRWQAEFTVLSSEGDEV